MGQSTDLRYNPPARSAPKQCIKTEAEGPTSAVLFISLNKTADVGGHILQTRNEVAVLEKDTDPPH